VLVSTVIIVLLAVRCGCGDATAGRTARPPGL